MGVVGRHAEWGRLVGVLDALRTGRPSVLVLRGDPGAGKTCLLKGLADVAAEEPITVVRLRGTPDEQSLGVPRLLDVLRVLDDDGKALPGSHAGQWLDVRETAGRSAPADPGALGLAALELLAVAARRQPVLVTVDDAHDLDPITRRALVFAARRLPDSAVAMVLCADGHAGGSDFDGFHHMRLPPLDDADSAQLLSRHAPKVLPQRVSRQLLALADGNPSALLELLVCLTDDQLSGAVAIEDPLLVTPRLTEMFTRGHGQLPAAAARALLVCATSFDQELGPVTRACELLGLGPHPLDEVEASGAVALAGSRARFPHPLTRAAVYTAASPADRRMAHRALAAALAPSSSYAALHLSAATLGRNDAVATLLDRAGEDATARGDAAMAASLHEQAAERSRDGEQRVERRVLAAEAALLAGQGSRAGRLLDAALADVRDPVRRGKVEHVRAHLALFGPLPFRAAVSSLQAEANGVRDVDPELWLRMRIRAAVLRMTAGGHDRGAALQEIRHLSELVDAVGSPSVRSSCDVALAVALAADGFLAQARSLLRPAADAAEDDASPLDSLAATVLRAWAHRTAESDSDCRQLLGGFLSRVRGTGAVGALPLPLALMAAASFHCGDFEAAHAAATEAAELAAAADQPTAGLYAATVQLLVAGACGREDQCRQSASSVLAMAEGVGTPASRATVQWGLGLLHLGKGRLEAAADRLRAAGAEVQKAAAPVSPGVVRWRADLVEALVGLGRYREAEVQADELQSEAQRCGSAYGLAATARCLGMLAGDQEIDAAFARALALHEAHPNRFENARLQLCWGRRLLAADRPLDARTPLMIALAAFTQLGADSWSALTREALASSGAVTPLSATLATQQLTRRQLQVARTAVGGASVDELAELLHLSPRTVRRELHTAMAVLDVRTPTEMEARLAEAGVVERRRVVRAVRPVVTVLGRFEVRTGDTVVEGLVGLPAQAVQIVAAHAGRMDADELAEMLWPEHREGTARKRLRNILWRVNEMAGPILDRDGTSVRIADGVFVDAIAFEDDARAALAVVGQRDDLALVLAARAVDRYTGPLQAGPQAQMWVAAPRERLRRRFLALVDMLTTDAVARGDVTRAVHLLERAIEADPYDEARYVATARLMQSQGRSTAALALLARAEALAAELGLPVPGEVRALRLQLHGR